MRIALLTVILKEKCHLASDHIVMQTSYDMGNPVIGGFVHLCRERRACSAMQKVKNLEIARQIAECVHNAGGSTYYVGGYVRDTVLGRDSKDIDLEIHGITPEVLIEILKKLGQPVVMGNSFGIIGLRHYDLVISMPRKDEKNSRGSKDFYDMVDPFVGTEKAARRRDLSMNAMMQDILTGEIIDHFGGVSDLERGIIRHVDDVTFAEDPLRVLRVAQFAARFQFSVAKETIRLAQEQCLSELPRERIWGELEKALMKSERPSIFFSVLREMDQLDVWFPEIKMLIGVEQEKLFHPEGDVWNHTMLVIDMAAKLRDQATHPLGFMLSALCHDLGKITATEHINGRIRAIGQDVEGVPLAEVFLNRLTNEVKLQKYVLNMVALHMRTNQMAEQRAAEKAMCRLFDQALYPEDLLLLAKADHCSRPDASPYENTEGYLQDNLRVYHQRIAMPCVMGADLIQVGFQPGKTFKDALDYAHKLQLAGVRKDDALKHTIAFLRKEEDLQYDGTGNASFGSSKAEGN